MNKINSNYKNNIPPKIEGVHKRNNEAYEYVFSDEDMKKMSKMKYVKDKLAYKQDLIYKKQYKIQPIELKPQEYNTEINVIQGDITKLKVDAIVNAANKSLLGGGGIDQAIHKAAGEGLLEECKLLHGCSQGQAKITNGYDLPANYVIHTVGPVWTGGKNGEAETLKSCYENIFKLSKEYNLKEIAIPAISSGVYGFPPEESSKIAIDTLNDYLKENKNLKKVIFIDTNPKIIKIYNKILKKT